MSLETNSSSAMSEKDKAVFEKLREINAKLMKILKSSEKQNPIKNSDPTEFLDEESEEECSEEVPIEKADVNIAHHILFISELKLLTLQEFKSIPSYMRGNFTMDKINSFINTFNGVCTKKYELMAIPKNKQKMNVKGKINAYKKQEHPKIQYKNFIVEEDVKEFSTLKVDRFFYKYIVILRHCQRLSEFRKDGLTRYVFH